MKKLVLMCAAALAMGCAAGGGSADREMDRYVRRLMKRMTLEEKIGQLNLVGGGDITTGEAANTGTAEKLRRGMIGGMFNVKGGDKIREIQRIAVQESRLGIPLLFGMDIIHGYKTTFPIPLGLSCSWDMDAVELSARIAAAEASASGISWTFSPMVDISRDPRWGRVSEGSGEDPCLGGEIAKAMVRGYQGDDLALPNTLMACVKHYALYGAPEAGRDYNTVDMSRNRMFNEYMYPYKAAVEAGVGSVMMSFNEVDGVPATANKWLIDDVLRRQWGFGGFVVTDYTGINEMVDHGIGDLRTVAARALDAGVDMDMVGEGFLTTLAQSLKERKVTQEQIDRACRRVLEAKYRLGLFDDPYRYCDAERAARTVYCDENRAAARRIASESYVLLKNENATLPLKKEGVVAVVGPLADTRSNMVGTWSVSSDLDKPQTVVEAIRDAVGGDMQVVHALGCNLTADPALQERSTMFGRTIPRDERPAGVLAAEALSVARKADVIVAALGEASEMSGESSSRTDIRIPDTQREFLAALVKTGKPVVLVLFTGRPLDLSWEDEHVPAILTVWFGGSEAAPAIADVLWGRVNPCGKLSMSFPRNVGQIPVYHNHKSTGRPLEEGRWFQKFRSNYLDVANDPLYPFGYGLSYTRFTYGDVRLSSCELDAAGSITASVTVSNSGRTAGKEVVQLYIRDMAGSITRPVSELKAFRKIRLEPGQSETVSFRITPEMLKFYDYDMNFVAEPGEFQVMIGGNSRDTGRAVFTLK